jgi:hypothetical protein
MEKLSVDDLQGIQQICKMIESDIPKTNEYVPLISAMVNAQHFCLENIIKELEK